MTALLSPLYVDNFLPAELLVVLRVCSTSEGALQQPVAVRISTDRYGQTAVVS